MDFKQGIMMVMMMMWIGFVRVCIASSGKLLWTWQWAFWFH